MYQRTQAQSDFPVENAKNLLKETNEEYNVRAVSYGTTQNALTCQYLLVLKKESVKGGSVHK
jgi:hypothetical protein